MKYKRLLQIKTTIIILILMLMPNLAWSETFRVSKVNTSEIKQMPGFESTVKMGINDALLITLPEDRVFIEGLELKMEIPESVAYWMDSVACSVYSEIKPEPSLKQIDYSGTRAFVQTLPGKLSWVLQIPVTNDNTLKTSKYVTKIDSVIIPQNNKVFLRLQPVMKGVPEETLKAIIPITVRPLLIDKGQLTLQLKAPKTHENLAPCTVYIDEIPVDYKNRIILATGVHNISVISEAYRNENRTVRIDQAKNTELSIDLKSIEPTLLINAPEGTKILLDNEECTTTGTEFVIAEGEHKLNFSIGNYEITRTITAIKGKTYTANFSLHLQISEE